MRELSMHVLDISQNSLKAGAAELRIEADISDDLDLLRITVSDDGCGMPPEQLDKALDPFYTTRATRKVGMGLPLLKMSAEMAGGGLTVESVPGAGTVVRAEYRWSHIDRPPMGNMAETIALLICLNPKVETVYRCRRGEKEFAVSSLEIKREMDGMPMDDPRVIRFVSGFIGENTGFIT